ncbi:MAG: glycosyltransferase, partial [Methylobacter sp.]|nr:glycosyltransferase [Methylobacter sp.]
MIHPPALSKKFDRSVSLLAWGYNEEQLIEGFLDQAIALMNEVVEDFEIIFVNDGSSDRTGEIVDAYALREPRLRVIHNE